MPEHVYFLTIGLVLGTILAVFAMRYYAISRQAKARLAHEQTSRILASQAEAQHTDIAAAVSSIQTALADIGTRLTAIERVLKEVE